MTGVPNTAAALAELRQIIRERRTVIARGAAPSGAIDRLGNLQRAAQIVFLASRITYFEAPDPADEGEAKMLGISMP